MWAMRRIRFLSAVAAVILLLSAAAPCAFALEAPEVSSARSYITGDAQTGRVLCDANAYTRSEPASLTKIMTVLLAVEAIEREEASLDDMVTVTASSHFDLTDDGTTAHINRGEVISLKDLLYCAMLVSANEACNIIAEHISGSVSEFVALMNARAEELGCSGTHFANTHGLPSKEHYTTARDLFIIAREAMSHELFAELCGTAKYTTARTNDAAPRELENSNALINKDSAYGSKYLYEGAKGIKTGHTDAAGYCLVSAAERNGTQLICVVLGASGGRNDSGERYFDSFGDTIKLYDWCFENFSNRSIVKKGYVVDTIEVAGAELELACAESVKALVPNDFDAATLITDVKLDEDKLAGDISSGDELGTVSFSDKDGNDYGTVTVVASKSVQQQEEAAPDTQQQGMSDEQKRIAVICGLIIAVVLILVVVSLVRSARLNRQQAKKAAHLKKQPQKKQPAHVKQPQKKQPAHVKQPQKKAQTNRNSGGKKTTSGRKGRK